MTSVTALGTVASLVDRVERSLNPALSTFEAKAVSVKLVLVAACALIDADGRVLLAERPAGKPMAGLWEFPGGKVEAGERPEQTLIRELKEELGIVVQEPCLAPLTFASHAYHDFHLLMPLYVCRRWEGMVDGERRPAARLGAAEPAQGLQDAAGGRAADRASDDAAVNGKWKAMHDASRRFPIHRGRVSATTRAERPPSNMR